MRRLKSWKLWAVVGGIILVLIVVGSLSGGSDGSSGQTASRASAPANPDFTMTAQKLYDEREANATRYDATYKGKNSTCEWRSV